MKSSMTQSDTQRHDYKPCEDSPEPSSGQAMWQLKSNYKHMKRIAAVFALIGLLFFQACTGPEGPQGPQGPEGIYIVGTTFEVEVNFTAATNFEEIFNFTVPLELGDKVLAFRLFGETESGNDIWRALPQSIFFDEGILVYNYDFSVEDFSLTLEGNIEKRLLGPEWTRNQIFRVLVVPADLVANARMDFTDYEAVTSYLGVSDDDFTKIDRK